MPLLSRLIPSALPPPPPHISDRYRVIEPDALDRLKASLLHHFFNDSTGGYLESQQGREDLENHLRLRLHQDRHEVVPWLDATRSLDGSRILEIGCGTGSSTVALAEQGSIVTGLDIDASAMQVAHDRSAEYKVQTQLIVGNATDAEKLLPGQSFDWIIFYASLEHMIHEERLSALQMAWRMLPPDGLLSVIETPNRLWYFDDHTSLLPFFHWLPDDLAMKYARMSPRPGFSDVYAEDIEERRIHFLRRGRGVSFHEFQLSLGPTLNVVSSMQSFQRRTRRGRQLRWTLSRDWLYQKLLIRFSPIKHDGFFEPYLYLTIQKG